MADLTQYRIAVEDYALNNIDYLFHNEGDEHALVILTNIFANSKEHIRIAANKLYNDEVVNTKEYIDSVKKFLDEKDTKLSIIITQKPGIEEIKNRSRENTLYWMLYNHAAYNQGRVVIREGKGKSFKDKEKNQINFCTGDSMMYRLEDDILRRKAVANFGDKNTTTKLENLFDAVFNGLDKVELSEYYK